MISAWLSWEKLSLENEKKIYDFVLRFQLSWQEFDVTPNWIASEIIKAYNFWIKRDISFISEQSHKNQMWDSRKINVVNVAKQYANTTQRYSEMFTFYDSRFEYYLHINIYLFALKIDRRLQSHDACAGFDCLNFFFAFRTDTSQPSQSAIVDVNDIRIFVISQKFTVVAYYCVFSSFLFGSREKKRSSSVLIHNIFTLNLINIDWCYTEYRIKWMENAKSIFTDDSYLKISYAIGTIDTRRNKKAKRIGSCFQ